MSIQDSLSEQWEAHGLECGIAQARMSSAFNGYVRLPKPFRNQSLGYDDIDVEAHCGLTFGMDEKGWIGFDTLHAWDAWGAKQFPDQRLWTIEDLKQETSELAERVAEWCKQEASR